MVIDPETQRLIDEACLLDNAAAQDVDQRLIQQRNAFAVRYRLQQNALIEKAAEPVTRADLDAAINEAIANIAEGMAAETKEIVDGLQRQIADLRVELAALKVIPLKGGRHDAA
jgi:hypothetical protein